MAGPDFSYAGWHVTFDDQFDTAISFWDSQSGPCRTTLHNGDRTMFASRERQVHVDPAYQGNTGHALGLNDAGPGGPVAIVDPSANSPDPLTAPQAGCRGSGRLPAARSRPRSPRALPPPPTTPPTI